MSQLPAPGEVGGVAQIEVDLHRCGPAHHGPSAAAVALEIGLHGVVAGRADDAPIGTNRVEPEGLGLDARPHQGALQGGEVGGGGLDGGCGTGTGPAAELDLPARFDGEPAVLRKGHRLDHAEEGGNSRPAGRIAGHHSEQFELDADPTRSVARGEAVAADVIVDVGRGESPG